MTERILEKGGAAIEILKRPEFGTLRNLRWELWKHVLGNSSTLQSRVSVVPELSVWDAM